MTTAEHVASYVDDAETSCTAHEAHALQLLDALLQQPEDGRERWLALQDVHPAVAAIALDLASAADRTSGLLERTVLGGAASAAALPPIDGALAALTTNYVIGEEIGRGGMARVFRARERKHDREVVVKLFAPIAGNAHGTERFLREVRIIAALAHPHIVPLIDSGAVHGRPYYVMPHLAGESMRARLHRGTRSSDEVIGVLRDVADALAFAHEAGVVHRDLKPENVLWASGHAYLLDFGIAKRLGHGSGEYATSPGFVLGTRRYMAPEQVVHPNQVGPSADCYAFGLLAYELLAGDTPPVAEARTFALGHLPAVRRDVSPALLSLIADCLHEDVQQRPESMAVVRARLDAIVVRAPTVRRRWSARHLLMTAVLMLSVVGTALGVRRLMTPVDDGPLGLPIAVATLRNETGDSTLTGITRFAGDWLTEGLQHVRGARVVPWATTSHLSDVAAAQGRDLIGLLRSAGHAQTVVTGTLYRVGTALRLQAQITDARSGRLLAVTPPVDVPPTQLEVGVGALRDRVMGAIATIGDPRLGILPEVAQAAPSYAAYQAFDRGVAAFQAQRYDEALTEFRAAHARDTTFTIALVRGARAAFNARAWATADSMIARARQQDTRLGLYHDAALSYLEASLVGDGTRARAVITRAADLAPNSRATFDLAQSLLDAGYARQATARLAQIDPECGELRGWSSFWTLKAHAAYLLGDMDASRAAALEMARRYPDRRVAQVLEARALAAAGDTRTLDARIAAWRVLPADTYWSLGAVYVVAAEELLRRGRTERGTEYANAAVAWLANRLVVAPEHEGHRYWLGSVLYDLGRYADARAYFDALAVEFPDRTEYRGLAALLAARRGDMRTAHAWLADTPPRARGERLAFEARIAAARGERERAIALLTQAADAGVRAYAWLPGAAFRDLAQLGDDARVDTLLGAR